MSSSYKDSCLCVCRDGKGIFKKTLDIHLNNRNAWSMPARCYKMYYSLLILTLSHDFKSEFSNSLSSDFEDTL